MNGTVYSLDANNGCTYWEFDAGKTVRSTISIGPRTGGWSVYFGDFGANVYAADALTGKQLWKAQIDDHPAARVNGSAMLVGSTLFVPVSSSEESVSANPIYSCRSFPRQPASN